MQVLYRFRGVPAMVIAAGVIIGGIGIAGPLVRASETYARPVWPGLPILIGHNNGCTLGFIFEGTDSEALYGSTAGHCVTDATNLTVATNNREHIGRIVAYRVQDDEDWALIRFHRDVLPYVRSDVIHWTGPMAPIDGDAIETEDVVCHYGGSIYHGIFMAARCGRHATFFRYTEDGETLDWFMMYGKAWGGDSGSPVIHYESGQAIGMLLGGLYSPYGVFSGMTVCGIVNSAAQAGYDIQLVTAAYAPPAPEPSAPGPATAHNLVFGSKASGDCT